MQFQALAKLIPLLAALPINAYFILSHPVLETTRLDPIVTPGAIGTHVHSIVGGSAFGESQTYAGMQAASCTTAPVTVDKSNYWAPQLYYYDPKTGGYQAIPVNYVNTYYLPRGENNSMNVTAFPDGLRMLSGDPDARAYDPSDPYSAAISYVCLDGTTDHTGDAAWAQRNNFFEHNCPSGMRAQINFPPCWDGVNLDSSDHQSHMAWPSGGVNGGNCPSSHPKHVVSLFYEFIFDVQNFPYNAAGVPTWVWANGDTTGYGLHGDFINGWPSLMNGTNVLQQALDQCNANNGVGGELNNCPPLVPYINTAAANACQPQNPLVNEDVGLGHEVAQLPGDNPIWIGNGSKPTNGNFTDANTTLTTFQSVIPTGWSDVGCIAEGSSGRALTGASVSWANMTRAVCINYCASQGFPLAGMEYAQECYCGAQFMNGATNTTLLSSTMCGTRCAANSYEFCGGSATLELFMNPALFPVGNGLEAGWTDLGCHTEPTHDRALALESFTSSSMTEKLCRTTCLAKGYSLAGVEYSSQCYCGNAFAAGSIIAQSTDCNMLCSGDKTQLCGGSNRLNVYSYAATANTTTAAGTKPAAPMFNTTVPTGWATVGCVVDPSSGPRALAAYTTSSNSMTSEICMSTCLAKGYNLAGVEYGSQCYCDTALGSGSSIAAVTDCNMPCAGNSSEICGAGWRLSTYNYTAVIPAPADPNAGVVSVANWASYGCWTDGSTRSLSGFSVFANGMTNEQCIATCQSKNYLFAATEYSTQCFCGNSLASSSSKTTFSQCAMPCDGASKEICGGPDLLTVWSFTGTYATLSQSTSVLTTTSTSAAATSTAPSNAGVKLTGWTATGCMTEATHVRALSSYSFTSSSMTNELCLTKCQSLGYSLAGTEYSGECYCGNAYNAGSVVAPLTDCSMTCFGNTTEVCGAGNRLSTWSYAVSPNSITTTTTTTSTSTSTSTKSTSTAAVTSTASTSAAVTTTSTSSSAASTTAGMTTSNPWAAPKAGSKRDHSAKWKKAG